MRIEDVSNLDALLFLLGILAIAAVVYRLIPREAPAPVLERFSNADITRHDAALPKYGITTTAALVLGALHLAFKSIPSVALWLDQGARGGHLAANIAYSHMIIVMGGTIAVTGLTWYALPRILQRPLYSETLAHLAYWGTVLGAGGFYLVNLLGGIAMSILVHNGMSDLAATDEIGLWRSLPTAIAATLMGLGYWIFVINVLITCWQGRHAPDERPLAHLAKYFVLGTLGLLVGTVQGVLQVVPDNEEWLAAAGHAGRYIDPISHAHVNLLTGVMMLVAGVAFYLIGSRDGAVPDRRGAAIVFWTLGLGSIALYLTFLSLGLAEGAQIIEQGLTFQQTVTTLGAWHSVPLLGSAGVVLFGLWALFAILLRNFARGFGNVPGTALVSLGAVVLFIGTFQGGLQTLPSVKFWMVSAGLGGEAIARTHAQFNMLGGVLAILLGMILMIGGPLVGSAASRGLGSRVAALMGAGMMLYYLTSIASAVYVGQSIRAGATPTVVTPLWAALPVIAGALLYAKAAALVFHFIWTTTVSYRFNAKAALMRELNRHNTTEKPWRARITDRSLLLPEALAALFGFPGLGWILSGRALVGVPLMFGGPALAWAILPLVFSPYSSLGLTDQVFFAIQSYLIVSAIVSVFGLWLTLHRDRRQADGL
ncbi:hypothetical protein LCGC14_1483740 [marine sediment metagenome]|uniref:Cytochrome oxidase subunit I profile domain-containing protein n=1 Tax=marine sediment metagenome TaxID=412755 RepID=A0A0F9J9D8_9ZZZZ